jgi:asparagine synthase (glutamine-hydrolysing)
MYFSAIELDDAELEMIRLFGTQAFLSGQAGDSVFVATMQPLPAIDYAYSNGLTRALWSHIESSISLSRESLWSVVNKVLKHGVLKRAYLGPINMLSQPTMVPASCVQQIHPDELQGSLMRRVAQSTLPPGKKMHLQATECAYYDYEFYSAEETDHVDPLNSQPVWEAMLRLPTYTLLAGGVSRGLVRQAFADRLPTQIRQRRTKGTGAEYYQQVVRTHRAYIKERLVEGLLVREGYLDRAKVMDCLTLDDPAVRFPATTIMSYLAAENWLRKISDGIKVDREHLESSAICS